MNFLAHAHLSGKNESLLFGNFIADSVKGNVSERYDPAIQAGIVLHRKIDAFTDAHPVTAVSKKRIRQRYGLYSGIVTDIFYDHFLARNWHHFADGELWDFSMQVYKIVAVRFFLLPPRIRRIVPFMIAQNWLNGYANINDLKRVFYGMDRRTKFRSGMRDAVELLLEHYTLLRRDFFDFYPELMDYVAREINGV